MSAVAAVAMVAAAAVHADNYPSTTVKLVVPFAPGGTTDIIARVVTAKIQPNLGQQMIVENRAGAGGVIGANETAKATPDGYSLGMATVSTVATVPIMQLNVPYKGAGPALNDVVGGQVLILLDKLPSSLPFIKQGRLIPIVIAADKRAARAFRESA